MTQATRLKGGYETVDPRLDRVPQFDEASRKFGVAAVVPQEITRGRSWPLAPRLNQRREGACVGFGWTHELAASPVVLRGVDDAYARAIYREAQTLDEWPGEEYEGTSVLAGAKVIQGRGLISEYRWAFHIDEVLRTLVHLGPVVFGTSWLDGMFRPRPSGVLEVDGAVAGGHCYLVRGLLVKPRLAGETKLGPVLRCTNSWGSSWGRGGDFFLKVDDAQQLLEQGGEACVPIGRRASR